jgi:hypothetical protein
LENALAKNVFLPIVVFSLVSIPVLTHAQSQAAPTAASDPCPLEITRVFRATSGTYVTNHQISASYRNTSGKDILAMKFGALFFNALDEPSASYSSYIDSDGLKWDVKRSAEGKEQKETTSQWSLFQETVANIDFYPLKVKFADGTFWKDDGTYACNAGVLALKIARHGGLAAQASVIADLDHKTKKGKGSSDDDK